MDICFEKIGSENIQESGVEDGPPSNDFVPYVDTFSRTINAITVILYLTMFFRLLLAGLLFCVDSSASGGMGGGANAYAEHHEEHHAIEVSGTVGGNFAGREASASANEQSVVVQQPKVEAAAPAAANAFSRPHAADYRDEDFAKLNKRTKKKKKPRQEFASRPTSASVYEKGDIGTAPKI